MTSSPSAVREAVLEHLDEHGKIHALRFASERGFPVNEVCEILEQLVKDGEVKPE